jgi:hypothetical protein
MELPNIRPYVLPNRRAFVDFVTKQFLKYRSRTQKDLGNDPEETSVKGPHELFGYQKLVRDFMAEETPYRGLHLNHGLGSGKTLEAIAIGLSLIDKRPMYLLKPASLTKGWQTEIVNKGRPLYAYDHHWSYFQYKDDPAKTLRAKELLNLPDEYMQSHNGIWLSDPNQPTNYEDLTSSQKKEVDQQIAALLNARIRSFNYNNSQWDTETLFGVEPRKRNEEGVPIPDSGILVTKNIFNHSVVVIDEAHLFIGTVRKGSKRLAPVYEALLSAKDCRIVFLSGTPIVNDPSELGWMYNALRGRMETYWLPNPPATIEKDTVKRILLEQPELDVVEYSSQRGKWYVTRNPMYFINIMAPASKPEEMPQRIGVKYDPKRNREETTEAFLQHLTLHLEKKGWNIQAEAIQTEHTLLLPDSYKEFHDQFVDDTTLKVKNEQLFMRRIQGLVSYFKGVDPALIPERIDVEDTLVRVTMSHTQWIEYQKARVAEIKSEASKARMRGRSKDEVSGNYRAFSRMVCNYALPSMLRDQFQDKLTTTNEFGEVDGPSRKQWNPEIMTHLREHAEAYFSPGALKEYSPKMLAILQTIQAADSGLHLVYSAFRTAQGVGFFAEVLKYAGYRLFSVRDEGRGKWVLDTEGGVDSKHPFFGIFSGEESADEREVARMVFSNEWNGLKESYPSVYESLLVDGKPQDNLHGDVMKVFMITSSGTAGLNLRNVRHVHVMEPFWNAATVDQVIGRAIRVNSHAELPPEERKVKVSVYMAVFDKETIYNPSENNAALIRKMDTISKRFVQEFDPGAAVPLEPATTDEDLYDMAFRKKLLSVQFEDLLKRAAIDCEVHKPLHARGDKMFHCLRYDTATGPEELAYYANMEQDPGDQEIRMNMMVQQKRLQRIRLKNFVFILNPETGTVYDSRIWDMSQRLLKVGTLDTNKQILQFD